MSKTTDITLDEAVAAARQLPADTQAELASELMEHVSTPDRPTDRQARIKEQLGVPLEEVSRDELLAVLRRYNPAG